jgi:Transposase
LLKDGSKSDRIGARKLAEQLYMNKLKPVYHGEHGLRTMKELARRYLTITRDLTRVMNRLKALYRGWGIPYHCTLRVTVTNWGMVPSLVEVETGNGEPGTGVSTTVVWSMAYPETEGGWFANWVPR